MGLSQGPTGHGTLEPRVTRPCPRSLDLDQGPWIGRWTFTRSLDHPRVVGPCPKGCPRGRWTLSKGSLDLVQGSLDLVQGSLDFDPRVMGPCPRLAGL